jgi:hypothetical protein
MAKVVGYEEHPKSLQAEWTNKQTNKQTLEDVFVPQGG